MDNKEFWVRFIGYRFGAYGEPVFEPKVCGLRTNEPKVGQVYKALENRKPTTWRGPRSWSRGVWGIHIIRPDNGKLWPLWDGEYQIMPDSGTIPDRLKGCASCVYYNKGAKSTACLHPLAPNLNAINLDQFVAVNCGKNWSPGFCPIHGTNHE